MKPNPIAPILTSFLVALAIPHRLATAAEAPVALGSAANFGVLAGSTVTSVGNTIVNSDLGLWPGTSVSGFPPGKVTGTMHITDPAAQAAQGDLTIAYNDAAARSTAPVSVANNIGGQTLAPGLYRSSSSLAISSGDLTLDGQGNPNAVFIFQIASTLVTTSGRQVILIGGAQSANVFWQVGSSATIGTTSGMKGNILALTSISIQTGATLDGRALAQNGAVTLDNNAITGSSATGGGGGPVASTNVFVTAVSPITLNPQTGLFEQTVGLANNSANTVTAVRLLIQALPADVQVYNASGSTNGTPFVQYNLPLAPEATVHFLIEYYRTNRLAIPQPTFVVQDTTATSVTATGAAFAIDRFVQLGNRFLIEFTAIPGGRYAVQYSSDMTNWLTADPIITAPANRVQWYDDGPPKTESAPTSTASRFYRVFALP
ncbi:MAG TPA: ice-binding family protein [Candidatus Binatia bacterium]|jgi:hypothetical protein|nr:ice-binding family protein [Candidatus Binatia bacterium]